MNKILNIEFRFFQSKSNVLVKNISFALFLLFTSSLVAQQENHYTMFAYNKMMYNPAFAGSREVASVLALYRNQWISFQGAPQSQLINFDTPLGKTKAAIGAQISRHTIGTQGSINANVSYSYAIVRTKTTSFRLGLNGSYKNTKYDFSDLALYIKDGTASDPSLSNASQLSTNLGNFGAGAYFDFKNFYAAFSVPNMYQNRLVGDGNAFQKRHYYLMTGAVLPINDKIQLRPALSFRYVKNIPMSFDANLMLILMKKVHFGASYRLDSQLGTEGTDFIAFFQPIGKLGVGVSYDLSLNKLGGKNNSGSIEALIRYDFTDPNGIKGNFDNPRFFF